MKIYSLFFFFIFSISVSLFSQSPLRTADLSKQKASWTAVIGGKAVSPCIDTSYGIALVSDGRLLSACTSGGKVIWQRSIKGRPSPYIASFGDFLYVVTDRNKINLINPSGMTLWSEKCPFNIADFPLVGKDGRVFLRGKNSIACYGIDGKRKWHESTEELGNFPISPLEDGSMLVFLKNPRKNRTIAARFSPFGQRLEDITFSDIVSSTKSTEMGVLISLKNGSIGLVNIKENHIAQSKWVNGSGNTRGAFAICYSQGSKNSVFFFQNGGRTEAVIVKTETGQIINRFQAGQLENFKMARETNSGFFISGAYSACEFSEDGTIIYAALLPPSKNWDSIFYTKNNYLIMCMTDWSMQGFLLNQSPRGKKSKIQNSDDSYVKTEKIDSVSEELGIRPLNESKMAEISASLKKGDYGEKEEEYLISIKSEAQNYIQSSLKQGRSHDSINFFTENPVYTQNLLYLMSRTGTADFSSLFASLLSTTGERSQLSSIISFAGEYGYDSKGQMLEALQNLIEKSISPSESQLLKEVCDATFLICRFMGRPSFNKRGKDIISHLFYPQYDKNVKDYARETLTKMMSLEK